jgi:glycosyltransferase involved in cell wall biosynthesis
MATVGIVIASYNPRFEDLARAVESVRTQTYGDWECVIVDDGSEEPISLDDFKVIRQENQGISAARNRGVAAVSGDYLAFLDQDDEWLPDKLNQQVGFMHDRGLAMCDTDFNIILGGETLGTGYEYHRGEFLRLLSTARIGFSTLMVRRDMFRDVGDFNRAFRLTADWEFELRVASSGWKFDRLSEIQCSINLHDSNASSDYRTMYQESMRLLRIYGVDSRPSVREAARNGRARMRELYAYQAIDAFRSTREPVHLLWAAQRAPTVVARSILAKARAGIYSDHP